MVPTRVVRPVLLVAALLVLLGAGPVVVSSLAEGLGGGRAVASAAVDSSVGPGAVGTPLYPGATGPLTVTVANPNAYPVTVTSIGAASSGATGPGGSCPAGTVVTPGLADPPPTPIAAGESGTYTLDARMIADPDDSCQGRTFTLPLVAQLASRATR